MQRHTITIALLLFFLPTITAGALEVTGGNLKIVLYEDAGRFNLFYRAEGATNDYVPLFSDRDPASSLVSVVVGNDVQTMEPGATFRQQVQETPLGARFIWTSARVIVTQDFAFISEGGVKITLTVNNVSESSLLIGAVCLFDGWLGEEGSAHFNSDGANPITQEEVSSGKSLASSWLSRDFSGKLHPGVGLEVITIDDGVTKPDKVIFANWKRLYDNLWDFRKTEEKDFSARPYSLNDSAVAQYYEPVQIAKNSSRGITIVLGNYKSALTTRELGQKSSGPDDTGTQEKIINESYERTVERVNILNNLLEEIDKKISAGEKFDTNDLEKIKLLLTEIRKSPETQFTDIQARVKILNNLLEQLNEMITSGRYTTAELTKMDDLIRLMEETE